MSKKSENEQKRLMAADFAQQLTKLTKPGVFEKAIEAVKQKNVDAFKKICKEEKISPKLADKMWKDFSEMKDNEISDGWTSGWT